MIKNHDKVPFDVPTKIRKYLQEKRIPVATLSSDIHVTPPSLHKQLFRNTIQVNRLWSICRALRWNLFQEIANLMEKEIYGEQAKQKGIEIQDVHEEVNQLKRKVELLERENDTLKEVIKLFNVSSR
ncbi:hypothetical protein [Marinifilum sp.]|uniref:hypothetical protein n=1 Tax=Marinifilum sp. TaxID=2033137 RepID=UPI003BAC940C